MNLVNVIFRNNILYREIARSRKGTCRRFANVSQRCGPFVFIIMGLKIAFHWFGLMSWRIRYKYSHSWNAVLCNNRRTRSEQQHCSSHPEVSRKKTVRLRKCINKVHFRCLITIWSIGIARRGFK